MATAYMYSLCKLHIVVWSNTHTVSSAFSESYTPSIVVYMYHVAL